MDMGILKVGIGAAKSVLADQWREYFYCPALEADVLVKKGMARRSRKGFGSRESDNLITNGSIIAVNEGQCMVIVDQGAIVDVCAEAGEFVYDTSTEPSIFYGDLAESISESFKQFGRRVSMGGDTGKDQRVYFFNTKEIMGNKYGTANPVPFRVVDANVGLDMDIAIRCFGEYSYRIVDPILFYKNVCGNVAFEFSREKIDSQLKSELLTALQPAFAKISDMGIRYSSLPGHTLEMSEALNEVLSDKWGGRYGIEITAFGVSSIKASEEDERMIKELQRNAAFRNPNMAAAHLVGAQASAMQAAASNKNAGPMMAFAGMNAAQNAGGANISGLFSMGQQQNAAPGAQGQQGRAYGAQEQQDAAPGRQEQQGTAPGTQAQRSAAQEGGWNCACGALGNTGRFCSECGSPRPDGGNFWTCSCGAQNKGKFCSECGKPKPASAPLYRCDKCGWEPEDPAHPPKFCPECGDPFDAKDIR